MAERHQDYYARNKQKIAQKDALWRQNNPKRWAFLMARQHAKKRKIDFEFTFEEWRDWWGDDFDNRGCRKGQLVMARFNDEGPYSPDNVVKAEAGHNAGDGNRYPYRKEIVKPA